MAKLVSVTSEKVEYWVNPLAVRWVRATPKGTVIEFIDGKTLNVAENPKRVANDINAVLDTASVWINGDSNI